MFTFSVVTIEHMQKMARLIPTVPATDKFKGFHYFTPRQLYYYRYQPTSEFYAVAKNKRGWIVGAIHLQKSPDDYRVWWITYVDVHIGFRKKGIAKGLYKAINLWVKPEMIIQGSRLSKMGQEAKLYEVRDRYITRCTNVHHDQELYALYQKERSRDGIKIWNGDKVLYQKTNGSVEEAYVSGMDGDLIYLTRISLDRFEGKEKAQAKGYLNHVVRILERISEDDALSEFYEVCDEWLREEKAA
jgi:GNAT superfamily N-acetyltransferase